MTSSSGLVFFMPIIKEEIKMTNIDRLKMEISDISYLDSELSIFLAESGLNAEDEYIPSSNSNKKAILLTTLAILEALANNPQQMKHYKSEDITISQFADAIQNRIDQLERKIRILSSNDTDSNDGSATWVYMFKE